MNDRNVKNRWWREDDARLIEMYRAFTLLWNPQHPFYNKKFVRRCALSAIADKMGPQFSVVDVKKRLKSLRDYYVRQRKKEDSARQRGTPGYASKWAHYKALEFLRPHTLTNDGTPGLPDDVPNMPMRPGAGSTSVSPNGNGQRRENPGPGTHCLEKAQPPELQPRHPGVPDAR